MKTPTRRQLLSGLFSLALASGFIAQTALADTTDITINAEVNSVVALRIETTSNGTIVSDDDLDPVAGLPANEILNFGEVDALGSSLETLIGTNAVASGTLERDLYVGGVMRPVGAGYTPSALTDGAIYHVDGGYRLRILRTDGEDNTEVDLDVSNTATSLDAVVMANAATNFDSGNTPTIYPKGTDTASGSAPFTLDTTSHTATQDLDLGVVVPLGLEIPTSPLVTNTTITFTAS